ncbi:unnamed protein product [Phytomonas sp. Hart1]|nr:unnamed protein product [Phytomonas sp. Hart1]|eukprot:CCW71617.1 unnamed protein product [Phytomonas sp. isolate Hart1]
MDDTTTVAANSSAPNGGSENETLLQNMVDFLGVMYGNKKILQKEKKTPNATHTDQVEESTKRCLSKRANIYKKSLGALQPFFDSTEKIPPQEVSVAKEMKRSKSAGENDYVGRLLNHLVRTYSTQMDLDDGVVAGGEGRKNSIINGDEKRASNGFLSSGNISKKNIDMLNFVNQTLDGFLRPNARQRSAVSMLSELEMDTNFSRLLSFHTHSNLQNNIDDLDKTTEPLKPKFIGEQAIFKSIRSFTKSKSNNLPACQSLAKEILQSNLPSIRRGISTVGKSACRALQSLTLDSKQLNKLRRSVSWNNSSEDKKTRSLSSLNGVDLCVSMNELMNQEELSRNIFLALEQQLRDYIISAYGIKKK